MCGASLEPLFDGSFGFRRIHVALMGVLKSSHQSISLPLLRSPYLDLLSVAMQTYLVPECRHTLCFRVGRVLSSSRVGDPGGALVAETFCAPFVLVDSRLSRRCKVSAGDGRNTVRELPMIPDGTGMCQMRTLNTFTKDRAKSYQKALFFSWSHFPGVHMSQKPSLVAADPLTHTGV